MNLLVRFASISRVPSSVLAPNPPAIHALTIIFLPSSISFSLSLSLFFFLSYWSNRRKKGFQISQNTTAINSAIKGHNVRV